MKRSHTIKTLLATTAAAFIVSPSMAAGSDASKPMTDTSMTAPAAATTYSDRERMTLWTNEKQRLEDALAPGQTKAAYMQALAANGYTLTSVNADRIDYLEYEVVKNTNSYEVQIDLDRAGKGKPVAANTADLKHMGYQITSTNDRDKDYVEIEIVKGQSTYEVQIDLDDAGKATKVDVTPNMWQSDATEKALDKNRI